MKIVNIILTSQNGGAEQVFLDYALTLKNLGHEITSIVKEDAPYADKALKASNKIYKIKNQFGYYDFFAVNNLKKILEESDADVVFAHVGRSITLMKKAIKKIKNKKIFLIAINHSMNVKRSVGADIVLSVNKQIFYRSVDARQPANRSFVISNAVDLSDAIEISEKIDLRNKQEVTIGVIGRLDKAKAFRYAIRAIKKLSEISDKNFKLKVAGIGDKKHLLRRLSEELGIRDKIEFLGWISDKKKFFSEIDIFWLTSIRETFGVVILEAMKYRKPIISTDADGPKEILQNETDGLIVSVEPLELMPERIADTTIRIINEPELANKIVENASIKLKEKFSYKSLELRLADILSMIKSQN